jgi:hypothetical protein
MKLVSVHFGRSFSGAGPPVSDSHEGLQVGENKQPVAIPQHQSRPGPRALAAKSKLRQVDNHLCRWLSKKRRHRPRLACREPREHVAALLIWVSHLKPQLAVVSKHEVTHKIGVSTGVDETAQRSVDQQQGSEFMPEGGPAREAQATISIRFGPWSVVFDSPAIFLAR